VPSEILSSQPRSTELMQQLQATQLAYLSNEARVYLGRAAGHKGTYIQEFA
jgi:hypothetical protein